MLGKLGSRMSLQSAVDTANTGEELHHSVTIGQDYDPQAKQFAELSKQRSSKLDGIWKQSQDPNKLLTTERRLRWG